VSSEGDGDDGEELEEDGGDGDRRLPVALARSPTVTCRAGRQFASSLAIYYTADPVKRWENVWVMTSISCKAEM
jgi:hypothetical protein